MRRRLFAYLALAWASPASLRTRPASSMGEADRLADLLALVTLERATATRMGNAYLAVGDQCRLATTEAGLRDSCDEGVAGLRLAIAALVRADLARGDTVLVEGWVLARAEAEALALISLNQTRSC